MTAIVPQFDALSEATVRRLVADLMADLEAIPDHRDRRGRVYPLSGLLAIHLLSGIGDGQGPEDAADFARDPAAWLRRLGILGDRIPSAQTLRHLLRDRDTDLLAELQPLVVRLVRRLEAVCGTDADEDEEPLEACAVDGKTVRASFDAVRGIRRTHIVSARLDCGLVGHQTAVPEKRGELTAIRQLLVDLELEGRVVSIDALACQTDIAQRIAEEGGWYLLAVKDNQSDLHAHLQRDFACPDRTGAVAHDRSETVERGHGRIERRICTIPDGAGGFRDELDPDRRWTALGCAVRVVAERTLRGCTARSVRHCITNLPVTFGAARVADLVRGHWGVENSLHWVLDDTFQEDRCRLRTGHAARNRAALRRIALNFLTLMQQYFWPKMSIRRLRKMVARNPAQLEPIMAL